MERYDGVRYVTTVMRENALLMLAKTNSVHIEQINACMYLHFRDKSVSLSRLDNSKMCYKHVYDWKEKTNEQINREFSELNWIHDKTPKESVK